MITSACSLHTRRCHCPQDDVIEPLLYNELWVTLHATLAKTLAVQHLAVSMSSGVIDKVRSILLADAAASDALASIWRHAQRHIKVGPLLQRMRRSHRCKRSQDRSSVV